MLRLSVGLLALALLAGCASSPALEAQQLAYQGEGPNPCLWGGVSAAAEDHCAQVRWGLAGYLGALNERARDRLPNGEGASACMEHVERLEQMLAARTDLRTERLYSCPPGDDGRCHLSLLVTDAGGQRYVLDNGAVLRRTQSPQGVGDLASFARLTGGDYRIVARADEVSMPDESPPASAAGGGQAALR